MAHVTKSYPVASLKANQDEGIIEAIVSVFGNVDLVGDRVVKGAFAKTISDWKAKNGRGRFLPFTDSHQWDREGRIGKVLAMAERDEGLWVRAKLFMEQQSAKEMFHQIKEGVVGEFSFAYDIPPDGERKADDGANELIEVQILDAAAALHGANPDTHLVSVKSDEDPHAKGGSGPATDTSDWDGNAAMTSATTAADYRAICAGEKSEGDPDMREHWALPHHKAPGRPANAAGVAAARARFGQTQGLKNAGAARTHLFETHTLPSDEKAIVERVTEAVLSKVGRVLSAKNESKLRDAVQALADVLDSLGSSPQEPAGTEGKAEEPEIQAKAEDPPDPNAEFRALLDPTEPEAPKEGGS